MKRYYLFNPEPSPIPVKEYGLRPLNFPVVKPGLSVSPKQMLDMASHGMSISAQNGANFYDGSENASWSVDSLEKRGANVADIWEKEIESRRNIKLAVKRDERLYGKIIRDNSKQKNE